MHFSKWGYGGRIFRCDRRNIKIIILGGNMEVKIKNRGNGWVSGKCDDYTFEAKVYETGSQFGINGGRVSKMTMYDENNNLVMNYDRGWDIKPKGEVVDIYANIMEVLENYKKAEG